MLRSTTFCSLVSLLAVALSACAARPAASTTCPPCEQQASAPPTAAAPTEPAPAAARVSTTSEPDYVALQLFVLDTQRTRKAPSTDAAETLPKDVWAAAGCDQHPCRIVSAPTLLGHRHAPMRLDIGNLQDDQRLALEAQGRARKGAIDLEVEAQLYDALGKTRMQFRGSVTPGGVTHLGTLGRQGNGAHEVFAVSVHGDAKDAVAQLEPWRPNAG